MTRYKSVGELHYSSNDVHGFKVHVDVDPGIAETYRALVPKSVRLQRTRYPPHISVVRKEMVAKLDEWGKHEGALIPFEYEPVVYNDETYYWLRCYSQVLVEIRRGLGLPDLSEMARGPDMFDSFHCTIGNCKG
jgi:hypothetical protein